VRRLLPLALALALAPAVALADPAPDYPLGALGTWFDRLLHGARHAAPAPVPRLHYVVGDPYEVGGIWHYPREQFAYEATGIASIYAAGHPALTSDGEKFDPGAMAAAHRTLQLPAIARITNLENGRQVLVRINDRGPQSPARLIAVTPAVARLLAFGPDDAARVRVELDQAPSEALAQQLQGGLGGLKVAAAPVGAVQAVTLPPPPGMGSAVAPSLSDAPAPRGPDPLAAIAVPLRLPPVVTQTAPAPGTLWVECDTFSSIVYAERERARLAGIGAAIVRSGAGRTERDTVRIGPIATIAEADAVLNRALGSGVRGARIVVEQE
jgi:rare lipoprotein A